MGHFLHVMMYTRLCEWQLKLSLMLCCISLICRLVSEFMWGHVLQLRLSHLIVPGVGVVKVRLGVSENLALTRMSLRLGHLLKAVMNLKFWNTCDNSRLDASSGCIALSMVAAGVFG